MILSTKVRRWNVLQGAETNVRALELAEAFEKRQSDRVVEDFTLPHLAAIAPLEPGERVRVTFTFERPFDKTLGLELYQRVRELRPHADNPEWGELSPEQRQEWESFALELRGT